MNRSEEEVLDQALNALYVDELEQEVGEDAVRAAIEEGTAQLRRGEGIRLRGKEDIRKFFEQMKAEGREALRAQAKLQS